MSTGKRRRSISASVPKGYSRVLGSNRVPAKGATLKEPVNPKEKLSVTIRIRRKPDAPPLPDQKDWTAERVAERQFLSREEFALKFGASKTDLDKVAQFARKYGLKIKETSVARRVVVVTGFAAQMSKAFGIELATYETPLETYRGRKGYIHVPEAIADIVEGVFGLDNRRMARRLNGGPPGASVLTPPEVAKLYNFPQLSNGQGQTIGLIEFGGGFVVDAQTGNPTDIDAFFQGLALKTPKIIVVSIDGTTNSPGVSSREDAEVALDIDVAGSIANGADIAVYFAPWTESGWVDVITTAVHDLTNAPTVLSISWGWPEGATGDGLTWTQSAIDAVSATFQEASAMGVTVFAASGDNGSNCDQGDGKAHVEYPASDPWVTSCGGTIITNVSDQSFTENSWNDQAPLGLGGTFAGGATGGGISDIFDVPWWQADVNLPPSANDANHKGRGVPDIAGNASSYSGYTIQADGQQFPVGGTSAVAPLYAGLVALISSALGRPLGFLNPYLYRQKNTHIIRDINQGKGNSVISSTLNGLRVSPNYPCTTGWDACTGLGVIDGTAMLMSLFPKLPPIWLYPIIYIFLPPGPIPDPPPYEYLQWLAAQLAKELNQRQRVGALKRLNFLKNYVTVMERALTLSR